MIFDCPNLLKMGIWTGAVQKFRQKTEAIIWTNDGQFTDIYVPLSLNELNVNWRPRGPSQ